MMDMRRKLLLGAAAVLSAVIVFCVVFYVLTGSNEKLYTKRVSEAKEYFLDGNYEESVLAYKEAIRIIPEKAAAYSGLAQVYDKQGYKNLAILQIQEGITATNGDPGLKQMLVTYESILNGPVSVQDEGVKVMTQSEEPELLTQLLNYYSVSTYADYLKTHEVIEKKIGEDGSIVLRHTGFDAEFRYYNTPYQPQAVVNGSISPNGAPSEIVVSKALRLFNASEPLTYEELTRMDVQDPVMTANLITFTYAGSEIAIECNEEGMIDEDSQAVIRPAVSLGQEQKDRTHVTGTVINAQNKNGIGDVTLTFYQGDAQESNVAGTAVTAEDGSYEIYLAPADYTVILVCEGFADLEQNLYVGGYADELSQDFIMSANADSGEIRLVMTWGSYPIDLDSYLIGTASTGEDVFINFQNPVAEADGKTAAELDLDDTDGFGPETITIYDTKGTYDYAIFDFMNTGEIGVAEASVTVYYPDGSSDVINMSYDDGQYNTWNVLHIEDGKVTIVDTLELNNASASNKS